MSIKLNDSIRVQGGKPVEDKRLNNGVVYDSINQANTLINKTDRYPTLEVAIKIGGATFIYWYKEGIENSDLVLKQEGGGGEGTLPSIMIFKDTVPTYNDLQAVTGQEQGWVYGVVSQGKLYVWIEDYGRIAGNNIWKDMGVTVDFSNYYTREEVDDLLEDYVVSDFLNTYFYTKEQSNNRYISKQGINLGDTGNIPEMKTGDISGIYRGYGASNPIQDWAPFLQMSVGDTYAQISVDQYSGALSYRAGFQKNPYTATRTAWDTGNLPNPATQTWVNQYFLGADTAIAAGFVNGNKEIPYIRHSDMTVVELATNTWVTTQTTPATQAEVEASTGTDDKPTSSEPATEDRKFLSLFNFFKLIKKLRYIHLLPNSATAVANRFWSNGFRLLYANNSGVASTVAYTSDLPTTFNYTPTGNFTTSQLKTAAENAGLIFNGLHIIIKINSTNYTLTVDNGADNPFTIITIGIRRVSGSSGSINIVSTRNLNTGIDGVTILNGNENSMGLLNFGTNEDLLTIKNQ